jgi:hypothetical protein
MATRSFTRKIEVNKPSAVRKIHAAMKNNNVKVFNTPIKDIDNVQKHARTTLASKLTSRY